MVCVFHNIVTGGNAVIYLVFEAHDRIQSLLQVGVLHLPRAVVPLCAKGMWKPLSLFMIQNSCSF